MGNRPGGAPLPGAGFEAAPRVYAMQLVAGPPVLLQRLPGGAAPTAAWSTARRRRSRCSGWAGRRIQFNRGRRSRGHRRGGPQGRRDGAQALRPARQRLGPAADRRGAPGRNAGLGPRLGPAGQRGATQSAAGMDGVVHAAGLAGELFTAEERDTLVNDGDLQAATASVATAGLGARSAHPRDARLDGRARHDVRADARCHPPQPGGVTTPRRATCRRCRRTTCAPPRSSGGGRRGRRCGAGCGSAPAATTSPTAPSASGRRSSASCGCWWTRIGLSPDRGAARRHPRCRARHRRRARAAGRHHRGRPLRRPGPPQQEPAGGHRAIWSRWSW